MELNGAGSLTFSAQLGDPDVRRLNLYRVAEPLRAFAAVEYQPADGDAVILQAGPVWKHSWDQDTATLTVAAAGLWSYYDHRFVLPSLAAGTNPATHHTSLTASLRTIAKRLVNQAHQQAHGNLPVVLEPDYAGSNVRNYDGFQLKTVGSALADLTAVANGPDIAFRPRRRQDDRRFIEWVLVTGDPMLNQGGGPDWRWDTSPAQTPIYGIRVERDGTGIASRWYVQGDGQQEDAMFAAKDGTALTNAGFPFTEAVDGSHTSVIQQQTLDDYATENLALSQRAVQSWAATVRATQKPYLGTYQPGDWARIIVGPASPYLPEGDHRVRITQISGGLTRDIQLQLQAEAGVPHD